jgi:hypothetical protein
VLLDGTTTSGIYAKEKATVSLSGRRMAKLSGLILGCSTFDVGGSVNSNDGVLALGTATSPSVQTEANGGGDSADRGRWRRRPRQRHGWRRRPGRSQMEAAIVQTEADGGGDPDRGMDGGGDPDGVRWRRR